MIQFYPLCKSSRLTSPTAVGSESTSISLMVPISESVRFNQNFSFFGSGSLLRRGEQSLGDYQSGQVNVGITYHLRGLSPESDYGARRLSVGFAVTPLSINTDQLTRTTDLTIRSSGASSSTNANATYRVLSPHSISELGVSLTGGLGYTEDGASLWSRNKYYDYSSLKIDINMSSPSKIGRARL